MNDIFMNIFKFKFVGLNIFEKLLSRRLAEIKVFKQ